MSALADISFLRPFWVLALPVLAVFGLMFLRKHAPLGTWSKLIDPHLMQAMTDLGRVDGARGRVTGQLPLWTAALIALALTGPALQSGNGQTFRNLDGVIFVVDVSESMTEDETWQDVVTMARAGLAGLGTKPAALVVFAGDSYAASALTNDTVQLGQTLALLDKDTIPDKGSRPALGLQMAGDVLEAADILAGDVVLMTDGAGFDGDALVAADRISDLGGRLIAVRVPTSVSGEAAADRQTFDRLSQLGGGRTYSVSEVNAFVDDLGRSEDKRLERQNFKLLFWTDIGRYVLLAALIPLAGLFRRQRA